MFAKPILLRTLLSFFAMSAATGAFAQLEKTIHQTFPVNDLKTITLDLKGEYIVEPWAGNTVMTETKIQLFNGTPYILDHFVEKKKRYDIVADTTGGTLLLASFDKKRDAIKAKTGECTELITLRVFIPDYFAARDERTFEVK